MYLVIVRFCCDNDSLFVAHRFTLNHRQKFIFIMHGEQNYFWMYLPRRVLWVWILPQLSVGLYRHTPDC
jgi:hypothetical protein